MKLFMREEFKKAYEKAQLIISAINSENKMVRTADIISAVENYLKIDVKFRTMNFSNLKTSDGRYGKFNNFGAAMCVVDDNKTKKALILLNEKETPEMKRFSLVHELGHLMLQNIISNNKYRICTHIDMNILSFSNEVLDQKGNEFLIDEQAANIFALVVLLPYCDMIDAISKKYDYESIANMYGVHPDAVESRFHILREEEEYNGENK